MIFSATAIRLPPRARQGRGVLMRELGGNLMPCATVGTHCNQPSEISELRNRRGLCSRLALLAWLATLVLSAGNGRRATYRLFSGGREALVARNSAGRPRRCRLLRDRQFRGQDALKHIDTPVARRVEMHSMATVGGLMQMRRVLSVDVPAQGRVRFEPSGLHAMLIDLLRPLKKRRPAPAHAHIPERGLGARRSDCSSGPRHNDCARREAMRTNDHHR